MLRFVIEQQNQRLVRSTKDVVVDVLPKASPELAVMPLNSINDVILIANRGFNAVRGDCGRSRRNAFAISLVRRT